jgi:hypothetical protein
LLLRLVPRLAPARARLERDLRAFASRLSSELPERPDGKTLAAAVAALVIVFGVSAKVLGSRSAATTPSAAVAPAPLPQLAKAEPSEPAPELAPEPTREEPARSHRSHPLARPSAAHRHHKHHAGPHANGARGRVR